MILHKLTRDKIEKFFHTEEAESVMHAAGRLYEGKLDEIHQKFMDNFRDYLVDEYSLFHQEIIKDGIEREVRALLLGDETVLARYAIAPNTWGIPSDHHKIRRKIVEENQDIIGSTYIQSLEEELARAQELNQMYRERY